MNDKITIKHSYNAGDLIVLMAGLKQLNKNFGKKIRICQVINLPAFYYQGAISPIVDQDGTQVCMNLEMFNRLKPLIEYQDYIDSFEVFEGQEIDFNIDLTRDSRMIPMPAGLIHHYAFSVFPEMSCDLSEPWIKAPQKKIDLLDKIIVNRTQRYNNAYINYYFLKHFGDRLIFMGAKSEHELFCKTYNLEIEYFESKNFLEVASAMLSYKGGFYNQSFLWHLADAMKLPRILELCSQFPNTFPTGANGYAFYNQKALEYFAFKHFGK